MWKHSQGRRKSNVVKHVTVSQWNKGQNKKKESLDGYFITIEALHSKSSAVVVWRKRHCNISEVFHVTAGGATNQAKVVLSDQTQHSQMKYHAVDTSSKWKKKSLSSGFTSKWPLHLFTMTLLECFSSRVAIRELDVLPFSQWYTGLY